ncbi:hypothetical protein OG729_22940 [Streptomyces sp. NBC_00210]|uniref:hypothetical protein n=1 Tax=Streptomyces sp. NBC_00210 TaxID=2903636 RepID=UPI003246EE6B
MVSGLAFVVHNVKGIEQYLAASRKSPITGLNPERGDVLPPYPTNDEAAMRPALEVWSRSA